MNFKTDDNGDLAIENNNIVLVSGSEEIGQLIQQRLNTFMGEYFLDITLGVPYFEDILKKNPNPDVIFGLISRTISDTDGVLELRDLDIDIDESTREMTIEFDARVQGEEDLITFKLPVGVK